MTKSALQIARAAYQPKLPKALATGAVKAVAGAATQSVADQEAIKALFPNTYGMPLITFEAGEAVALPAMNVGVILSGGQAPGGHNVISGLFDGIKKLNPENKLYGFILGPGGLVDHNYMELPILSTNTVTQVVSISSVPDVRSWKQKANSKRDMKSSKNLASKHWLSLVVTTLTQTLVYWLNTMQLRTTVYR